METQIKQLTIRHAAYEVVTDLGYGTHLGDRFEPHTVAIMEALLNRDSRVLDIGANIGITGLALSQISPEGRIVAIEPVPATFEFLVRNLRHAEVRNVTTHNFALGKAAGEVVMQGSTQNLSGAFVADNAHPVDVASHFKEKVKVFRLDDAFEGLGLDRLDMIKMDVEGYEIDVLEGAASLLVKYKPRVFLEMNHIALNLWRGMSLPEFRRKLLNIFPFAFAVGPDDVLDLTDGAQSTIALYSHLNSPNRYADIVAGFDRDDLVQRVTRVPALVMRNERIASENQAATELTQRIQQVEAARDRGLAEIRRTEAERDQAIAEADRARAEASALKTSRSWKVTAPLRGIRRRLG